MDVHGKGCNAGGTLRICPMTCPLSQKQTVSTASLLSPQGSWGPFDLHYANRPVGFRDRV